MASLSDGGLVGGWAEGSEWRQRHHWHLHQDQVYQVTRYTGYTGYVRFTRYIRYQVPQVPQVFNPSLFKGKTSFSVAMNNLGGGLPSALAKDDRLPAVLARVYRAGLSQKAWAGLARLGSETNSKSELGLSRAQNKFEFSSSAVLGIGKSEIYELSLTRDLRSWPS